MMGKVLGRQNRLWVRGVQWVSVDWGSGGGGWGGWGAGAVSQKRLGATGRRGGGVEGGEEDG